MSLRVATAVLAALVGVSSLLLPGNSYAGTVGYYIGCRGTSGSPASAIIAAGHTPVEVSTINAAALAPLNALVMNVCTSQELPGGAAINAAVANGMGLVLENVDGYSQPSAYLPGSPSFTPTFGCPVDINIAYGTPIASGVGGTLTNSSFDDLGDGLCALTGRIPAEELPAGAVPFLNYNVPSVIGAFGYTSGRGRIAYSISQFFPQLPGNTSGYVMPWAQAASVYMTNALAWTLADVKQQTCASEGYTGTKLTWCQNICEKGYTGATLNMWIKRWTDKYRDLPYCAK